jgi:hypothetical protein
MTRQDSTHVEIFRHEKLLPGEALIAHLDGWIGEKMGQGERVRHNGQFILTNERACFYRKDPFEEIFETIPLSKISSVETLSLMGYRVLRLHTAHDDLEFKTHEPKAMFNEVLAQLERLRTEPADHALSSTASTEFITDQIKKLAELRDDGLLTEDEFNTKKTELLARL